MDLAARIKQLRTARGWSQQALAERARVSQQLISRIERGMHVPDGIRETRKLPRIAGALGMSVDELLSTVKMPAPNEDLHLTDEEKALVSAFRLQPKSVKDAVKGALGIRLQSATPVGKKSTRPLIEDRLVHTTTRRRKRSTLP